MEQQRLQAMQALMTQMGMGAGGGGGGGFTFGGGGGGGGGGGSSQSQIQAILQKIKNHGNEADQLAGLNEFIEMLNMATEQIIMAINPQQFVGPIMACFQKHHNPELMLVAARSLTYLVDANTHTVRVIQREDHLNVLLDSLRSIMDVEFAEQVLTCVDKISADDPSMLLQRDGVSAIMGFLDFFSITTQRLILHTVARIADSFRPQYYSKIESSLPTIRTCLRHDDNRMREEALTALTRFVKRSSLDPRCVKDIFGDAGPAVMEILEKRPTNAMFGTAIQLISTATNASAAVCESLITIGAVSFLAGLLESSNPSLMGASSNNTNNINNSSFANGEGTPTSPFRASSVPNNEGSASNMGSPISSVLNNSGQVNASASSVAAAAAQQRIPHERIVDICNCLVSFAPDITDPKHYINYIDRADRAKPETSSTQTSPSGGSDKKEKKKKGSARAAELHAAKALLKALARAGGNGGGSSEEDDDDDDNAFMFGGDDDEDGSHDEEGAGGADDDDEYDDYNPHDMPPAEQKEHLAELITDGRLKIDNKVDRNKQCTNGRHTCDVCGDRISDAELWLRCNERTDYDLCAACVLDADGDEDHTYTHMKSVFATPSPTPAPAAGVPARTTPTTPATAGSPTATAANPGASTPTARAEEDQRALRVAMVRNAPYLVNRLAEALPVVCRLHLHNDDAVIRTRCLAFICRVVHYATAECLRQVLLDCPMCELVTYLLTSSQLSILGSCIHICEQLMAKLPDVYTDLFIREGVTNGLAVVKSFVSVEKRAAVAGRPITSNITSYEGWRAVLAFEANEILNRFENSVDSGRIAVMESLCTRLRTESSPTAAIKQVREVLSDISTFELMNSDVIGSILARFSSAVEPLEGGNDANNDSPNIAAQQQGPEELVALFVSELASQQIDGDQHYSTLLGRFIHQLQSSVSQIEKFTPPNDGADNARDPIRLTLRPHDPSAEANEKKKKKSRTASSDAKAKASSSKKASSAKKGSSASTANNDDDDENDNDNAAPAMKKTEGKSATVSIDPLASVLGIIDFIRSNLLPNSQPAAAGSKKTGANGATEDNDDPVEEIDPTAPASPTMGLPSSSSTTSFPPSTPNEDPSAAKRARKEGSGVSVAGNGPTSPTSATPTTTSTNAAASAAALPASETPIYLRYKTHALPGQWTMLQVMQQIVNKDKKEDPKGKKGGNDSAFGGAEIPWQLRQLMAINRSEIVDLYYSTEPFTSPTVTTPLDAAANKAAAANASSARPVRFNPNLLLTSGAVSVRSAISRSYHGSAKFVSPVLGDILRLLNVLYAACSEWSSLMTWLAMKTGSWDHPKSLTEPRIAHSEFVSPKVNSKAMQHSANVTMTGQHEGAWYVRMVHDYPCLFTPSTRKFLFEVTYFGISRSLVRLQELAQESGTLADNERALAGRRQNRMVRRKCRVVRERPLDCAMQVLASNKATLGSVFEFEFKGEPGSGLGPTMEFYALVGAALSEKSLGLWRRSEDDSETHFTPMMGLYPAPLMTAANTTAASASSSSSSSPITAHHIAKYYTFLGRFLARVLLDRRIPNLRLSRPLLKMLRGDELAFDDIYCINPKIYEVLLAIVMSDHSPTEKGILSALPKPCAVEDLCLNFTLPGMEEIPLIPNGADVDVTRENMTQYAQELSTALLCDSVNTAVKALRDGFGSVINLQALRVLTVDELSATLKGHEERITLAELEANVACDHGYSSSSPTIRIFLEILSEMSVQEQQKFFQFLTGSPMLPVGGLAALKPKFTIVRKTSSDPRVPEQTQLPSAMTCQNFLKLPAYETKALMLEKLKLAVDEGANAFLFT